MKDNRLDMNREEVLNRFYNTFIIPRFKDKGYILPPNVRVSIGVQEHRAAIGSTYHPLFGDNFYHIFISPKIARDVLRVFDVLIHEAIHTLFFDHLAGFSTCAAAVGLKKPWTATTATDQLINDITDWLEKFNVYWNEPRLGGYDDIKKEPAPGPGQLPGPGLRRGPIGGPKVQTGRMVLLTCPICGYKVRTAKNNITTKGPVICPVDNVPFIQ
jgi:hypothetical protein